MYQYDDPEYLDYSEPPQGLSHQISMANQYLTLEEVFEFILQKVSESQELLQFDSDNIIAIILHYNFDDQLMSDKLFSEEQESVIEELKKKHIIASYKIEEEAGMCSICFEEGTMMALECRHFFCHNCFSEAISQKVNKEESLNVLCLQDRCLYKLPFSFIDKETDKYRTLLCKKFVEFSSEYALCTAVDCSYIIRSGDCQTKQVTCKCGHRFCFRCKVDLHFPAPCDIVKKWILLQNEQEANFRWILENTKICPFCQKAVERSMGCNYMSCKPPGGCGGAFCYVCEFPWEPDHSDHFNCYNIARKVDRTNDLDRIKQYQTYYQRYAISDTAHKEADKRLSLIENYEKMAADVFGLKYSEITFMKPALKELIHCRQILKWCYCLEYFYVMNPTANSFLFEQYLSRFELSCEQLGLQLASLFEELSDYNKYPFKSEGETLRRLKSFHEYKVKITTEVVTTYEYRMTAERFITSNI